MIYKRGRDKVYLRSSVYQREGLILPPSRCDLESVVWFVTSYRGDFALVHGEVVIRLLFAPVLPALRGLFPLLRG